MFSHQRLTELRRACDAHPTALSQLFIFRTSLYKKIAYFLHCNLNIIYNQIEFISGSLKGNIMIKYQGFTLSELMIVIAVLAILSALAVPSFSALSKKGHLNKARAALVENVHFMEQHYAQHKTFKKNLYGVA